MQGCSGTGLESSGLSWDGGRGISAERVLKAGVWFAVPLGMDWVSLGLTTVALTIIMLCVVRGRRLPGELAGAELERWFAKNARRLWVLLAGTALVLVGVLIAPLPGPGFMILGPLGIAMLATEFVWARRLMREMDRHSAGLNVGVNWFVRRTRLWLAVFLLAAFLTGATAIGVSERLPGYVFWPCLSIGLTFTAVITIRSWRRHKRFLAAWKLRREREAAKAGREARAA